ncbi:MAG TPA: TlpA disulfide reductase family protein [Dermatophilaceae bacterium]|nr:TlpA disulfide reductase family protein [Dermatophilaceae bacterium]
MMSRTRRTRPVCRVLAAAAALTAAATMALAGCSEDPNSVAAQAKAGDRKGFISGDGSIDQVALAARAAPISVSGTTLDGAPWATADAAGKVVVLNVWGSWCPPCVDEADDLQRAWQQLSASGKPVVFMGINFRDPSPQTAAAFLRSRKITYPSLAYDGGRAMLGLQGKAVATPTTLVLDRAGRIAARVSGPVTTATLTALVTDVLAEPAA